MLSNYTKYIINTAKLPSIRDELTQVAVSHLELKRHTTVVRSPLKGNEPTRCDEEVLTYK